MVYDLASHYSAEYQSFQIGFFISDGGKCDLFVNLQLADKLAVSYYGAPADVWVRYSETPGEQHGKYSSRQRKNEHIIFGDVSLMNTSLWI